MATKKELVEAHAFSRRRLVTAFLSGAPGGREVEPTRPARALAGGTALAVLLCAGAAVAGYLGGRPNSDWTSEGSFVISKDTGEQYVVLNGGDDPVIQRVPNFVSGQLLLGTAEPSVFTVKDEHIRTVRLGEDLGIERAPAGLPDPDGLLDDGWTACTAADTGVRITMDGEPAARLAPEAAFVVRSPGGAAWLLAAGPDGAAYRYELPRGSIARSNVLDALGFGAAELAPAVTEEWLNLFPAGSSLAISSFGIDRLGERVDYPDVRTDLSGFRIGELVADDQGHYLLGDEGPYRVGDFTRLVHEALRGTARALPGGRLDGDRVAPDLPAEWPTAAPVPVTDQEMCAVLQRQDGAGRAVLGVQPDQDASAVEAGLTPGEHEVDVDPAGGAYVLSTGAAADTDGSPYVIDAKGLKYPLIGPDVDEFIGYGDVEPLRVPAAWMDYFAEEVALSVNAARRANEDASDPDAVTEGE